jgi:hypothetical protein
MTSMRRSNGGLRSPRIASVPGRSVRPGRSPALPRARRLVWPVRGRVGDRYCRGRSRTGGGEFLLLTWLAGGDRCQAPHVKKAPQLLVTGGVVRSVHRLVALAEELLMLSFGEVQRSPADRRVFRRLCGHATQLTPYHSQPACRTGQDAYALRTDIRPSARHPPDPPTTPLSSQPAAQRLI